MPYRRAKCLCYTTHGSSSEKHNWKSEAPIQVRISVVPPCCIHSHAMAIIADLLRVAAGFDIIDLVEAEEEEKIKEKKKRMSTYTMLTEKEHNGLVEAYQAGPDAYKLAIKLYKTHPSTAYDCIK